MGVEDRAESESCVFQVALHEWPAAATSSSGGESTSPTLRNSCRTRRNRRCLTRAILLGAKARDHFPGGVFVDAHHSDFDGRIAETQAALAARALAIFEAAFFEDDIFVAVDVLELTECGWTLVEVKSSTGVKQQDLSDAAIQTSVVRRSGLRVERVEIMHLNRECRFPDLRNLFVRADVTDEVAAMLADVVPEADAQSNMPWRGRFPTSRSVTTARRHTLARFKRAAGQRRPSTM